MRTILAPTMAILVLSAAASAQSNVAARQSLEGLKRIRVVVEDLSAAGEAAGLQKDAIQTDVELRLRKAGIAVGEGREWEGLRGVVCTLL